MNIETIMAIVKALQQLRKEGMLVDFNYNLDGEIPFFIPTQPVPDIPNWREWCLKLQACGVMFESNWGDDEETDWRVSACAFSVCGVNEYRIPKQPVPATIVNYLNEEKTMSKFVKIQLPEIEVSEDVTDVKVCFYDGDRLLHNTAGVAIMDFNIENGRIAGSGNYQRRYIHGTRYTKEAFERVTQPPKEMTVKEVEKILGHKVKIVGKTE